MKIKRYFAATMREAIRAVRDEQGPDAVILSNQRVDGGIEIIAAVDYDESLINQALPRSSGPTPDKVLATRAHETPAPARAAKAPPRKPERSPGADPALTGMRRELSDLRQMLECQLSSLAWNDLSRREPVRASVLRELTRIGLAPELARRLVKKLPTGMDPGKAWRLPLAMLSKQLPVAAHSLVDRGGVVAMVGPTGVGKTTSIAKLAARFALKHRHRDVALVTTDNYRIGAHEQLFTFGRILGVPVYVAEDARELAGVLERTRDKRLVLIDTAGVSGRDRRLVEQFGMLSPQRVRVETCLVLAANAEATAIERAAATYAPFKPRYCIATKLDEAASLGGVLSAAIDHNLPFAYVSDGQRVPEDFRAANGLKLVCEAVECAKAARPQVDESAMAQRFGSEAVAYA